MSASYNPIKLFQQLGASLIEAGVFIIVISIIAGSLLIPIMTIKNMPGQIANSQALELAKGRMEVWIKQKHIQGYSSAQTDPCSSSSTGVCQVLSGFNVNTSTTTFDSDPDITEITIEVTGDGYATLKTLIANDKDE